MGKIFKRPLNYQLTQEVVEANINILNKLNLLPTFRILKIFYKVLKAPFARKPYLYVTSQKSRQNQIVMCPLNLSLKFLSLVYISYLVNNKFIDTKL